MSDESRAVVFVGTRPEAVKLAPVVIALRAGGRLRPVVVTTGQHPSMAKEALAVFGVCPDHELQLGPPVGNLTDRVAKILEVADELLKEVRPRRVLVQGDTATAFAGALAAFHQQIPVGHVEAGLRTRDLGSPWPEEAYRQMVARISQWHFAPTVSAKQNLIDEAIDVRRIHVTGNTVVDALERVVESGALESTALPGPLRNIAGRIILATGHRRENFDGGLERICRSLREVLRLVPDTTLVWPLHPNPDAQSAVHAILGDESRAILCPPLQYLQFLSLLSRSSLVVTDSGGVQEEAPSFGVPVVITRERTERIEGLESENIQLVGTGVSDLVSASINGLGRPRSFSRHNPYGDGRASDRIAQIIT